MSLGSCLTAKLSKKMIHKIQSDLPKKLNKQEICSKVEITAQAQHNYIALTVKSKNDNKTSAPSCGDNQDEIQLFSCNSLRKLG